MCVCVRRASCGRIFGKADEDGSVERFMLVQKVPQTLAKTGINMSILGKYVGRLVTLEEWQACVEHVIAIAVE